MKTYQSFKFATILIITAVVALATGGILKFGISKITGTMPNKEQAVHAQQVDNQHKPTPTASIIQATQYLPASQEQKTNGIKFTVSNFFVENNHVFTDVCYDLPGKNIWDINAATLQYGQLSTGDFAVSETSITMETDIEKGYRCLRLDFYNISPNADLSSLTLTVGNIGQISPMEGFECQEYTARIHSNLKAVAAGIKVACEQSPSGVNVQLIEKSSALSENEANIIISEAMFNQVNGPWVFTVTQNK